MAIPGCCGGCLMRHLLCCLSGWTVKVGVEAGVQTLAAGKENLDFFWTSVSKLVWR